MSKNCEENQQKNAQKLESDFEQKNEVFEAKY